MGGGRQPLCHSEPKWLHCGVQPHLRCCRTLFGDGDGNRRDQPGHGQHVGDRGGSTDRGGASIQQRADAAGQRNLLYCNGPGRDECRISVEFGGRYRSERRSDQPHLCHARYVRHHAGGFKWCECRRSQDDGDGGGPANCRSAGAEQRPNPVGGGDSFHGNGPGWYQRHLHLEFWGWLYGQRCTGQPHLCRCRYLPGECNCPHRCRSDERTDFWGCHQSTAGCGGWHRSVGCGQCIVDPGWQQILGSRRPSAPRVPLGTEQGPVGEPECSRRAVDHHLHSAADPGCAGIQLDRD